MAIVKKKAALVSGAESTKVFAELRKQHGEGIGVQGGKFAPVPRIPLRVFPFDLATGGGIPRSRLSIFTGPESSGKSLNMYLAMAEVQARGETAVLIDAEHAWDPVWGLQIGLDLDKLIIIQPDNAEQAVDAAQAFLYAKDVGIVGVDSVSAMVTQNEIQSEAGKMIVAGSSMQVTNMVHKVGVALSAEAKVDHLPAFLVISQTRYEIGKMFGDPEKMTGGNALKFASSMTVRFYGKPKIVEAINKDKPTFKYVQGVIKKYRCPIVGTSFEYDQALIPHGHLRVGQVEAWSTVESFLKAQGHLQKGNDGWHLLKKSYKTLDVIKARYRAEPAFARECEALVAASATKIDTLPKNAKVDKATGELL